MSQDQKTGILIVIVAIALMAATLVLSKGWGVPGVSLFLFQFSYEGDLGVTEYVLVETRYVLAALILVAGYGVARYMSVIPPIFQSAKKGDKKDEGS